MSIRSKLRGEDLQGSVEIDLNQPVVGKICVKGTWYKVEYEGLHILCGKCGCYGHVTRNCSLKPPPEEQESGVTTTTHMAGTTSEHDTSKDKLSNPSVQQEQANSKESIIANDKAINDKGVVLPETQESPHGDWLVVARKKKQSTKNMERNKG